MTASSMEHSQGQSSNGTGLAEQLESLVQALEQGLATAHSAPDVENIRVAYLGRKGLLAGLMSSLAKTPPEQRPLLGQKANQVKAMLQERLDARLQDLERNKERELLARFDPSLPGRAHWLGSLHPVTLVTEEICQAFVSLGFDIVEGPELETDFYNFEALNLPPDHPARDMQDTFYIGDQTLLRTHTSPLQVRTMERMSPPLAAIAPGKVYRRDSDLTHTPMFHQIEGFVVDKDVSMADLRGTLTAFVHQIFGQEAIVRFRPSFFPFTEPSAEVDVSCMLCGGRGICAGQACRVCKQTGWLEILGCGMIDPAVFAAVGYDPEVYTGFAFGLGVERVAMLKYGIGDLRMFFENDTRFVSQFG
ncbi:phenylalanyl-tRNA synthetase, alpha subunit [Desulfonatronum thiosulfatophilum]|uniref:Phenylalanine--tRNA ligase alpha subunit n=1 Tax=Desulfonatronum thiosulfatophilum TaxID=617002 RepID=A0A1G6CVN4_9BACT|nr:phenylalanyl-tRNA synthetase, alpha subunit [Desulfonatronum thiosulfatophilum]